MLRINLFAGLSLSWNDEPLSLPSGKAASSLLAYLIVHHGTMHTRDLLSGLFWPDVPDDVARRRLSQALWRIRRALSPHRVLLAANDAIGFAPDIPLWSDVEAFRESVASGADAEAVALYQGGFMAGYYDDWILLERERLREMFLRVLENAVLSCKMAGDYEGALLHVRRLVSEDPLRELAHCEIMRLCHLLGRDDEALHQYRVCCQLLNDELGALPAASTVALAREITALADDGALPHLPVAPSSPVVPALERPDQVVLVGRQAERAEMARSLTLAAVGKGGMVLLTGEAGVGKTRLMQEVARDAVWHGVRVVWGHSCDLEAPLPYQPLVQALRGVAPFPLSPLWRRELARLMPELDESPSLWNPEQGQSLLLEALAQAFVSVGRDDPCLVILEDVHWMDQASFDALRVLLPRLPTTRLLLVLTLRPEELAARPVVAHALTALEDTRLLRRIPLAPLAMEETEELVRRVLGLNRPAPRFARRLYQETEGNPFFVSETLRALVSEGVLYRNDKGVWSTPWDGVTEDYAELRVPTGIVQSIRRRLERLPPLTQELLSVAAAIGQQVDFDLWWRAAGHDEDVGLVAIGSHHDGQHRNVHRVMVFVIVVVLYLGQSNHGVSLCFAQVHQALRAPLETPGQYLYLALVSQTGYHSLH